MTTTQPQPTPPPDQGPFDDTAGPLVDGIFGPPADQPSVDASPGVSAEPAIDTAPSPDNAEPAPADAALDAAAPPESPEPSQGEYGLSRYFSSELGTTTNGRGTSSSRIIDLTDKANKAERHGMRDPKQVYALVLHQMACCFKVKDPMTRFLKHFAPHFAILPDGRILQLHPVRALTWASNLFNKFSVAVEFAGNFPNTKGKWWFDRRNGPPSAAHIKANSNHVTPEQIEAGRFLVRHLIDTMGLRMVVAHRQSSKDRENDPGPDVWYHVGQWAIGKLGLSDGGAGYKIGTGNPIPDLWRKWGETKPQKEFV
jgi:hypothetical protein